MKKPKPGSDSGNMPENYGSNQSSDTEMSAQEFESILDTWNNFQNMLSLRHQYKLISQVGGSYAGFNAYYKCHDIEGLDLPEGFWYWKKVDATNEVENNRFQTMACAVLNALRNEGSKYTFKNCNDIEKSLFIDVSASNSLSGIAKRTRKSDQTQVLKLSLAGMSGGYKVFPQESWFPKQLLTLNVDDLLRFLPPAERKIFKLVLGRAAIGASGSETVDGISIEHTSRYSAFCVGEPGMGKSTLIGYIRSALQPLGYRLAVIQGDAGSRFGWGDIATSDLAYIDDLNSSNQSKMLNSDKLKSIISNGYLTVEDKGVKHEEVRATSVVMAFTNHHNYADFFGMDAGTIDRLNFLQTYSQVELNAEYKDIEDSHVIPLWKHWSKYYNVTREQLAMYLLMRCGQKFLAAIGYKWEDSTWSKEESATDTLKAIVDETRKNLRIDISNRHADEVAVVAANLLGLALASLPEDERRIFTLTLPYVNFSHKILLATVEVSVQTNKRNKMRKPFTLQQLSASCKEDIKARMNDIRRICETNSTSETFAKIAAQLSSKKSYGYPKSASFYEYAWSRELTQLPFRMTEFEQMLQSSDYNSVDSNALRKAVSVLTDVLNEVRDESFSS